MQDVEITIDHGHSAGIAPVAGTADGRPDTLAPQLTVVQLNIYRDAYDHYEYLLLKRLDENEAFWQVVTEPVADHDTLPQTLKHAVTEQTGIRGFKHLSSDTYSYEWYAGRQRGRDIVFAAEVSPQTEVKLDGHRYSQYAWLTAEEAIQRLKWNGNKQALRQLDKHLHIQRLETPASVTHGFYGNGSERMNGPLAAMAGSTASGAVVPPAQPAASTSPFSGDVPKRLPDRPEEGLDELKPYPEEDDERTGAWFL